MNRYNVRIDEMDEVFEVSARSRHHAYQVAQEEARGRFTPAPDLDVLNVSIVLVGGREKLTTFPNVQAARRRELAAINRGHFDIVTADTAADRKFGTHDVAKLSEALAQAEFAAVDPAIARPARERFHLIAAMIRRACA